MQCDCMISFPVDVIGLKATTCERQHLFTTGGVGWSVVFNFGGEWAKTPYRTATFWAGEKRMCVQVTGDTAIIPPELLTMPFVHLYVSVYGKDCEPDAETINRAAEINERLAQIDEEIRVCDESSVKALMDEYMTLVEERSGLNLVKKAYSSSWCRLAYILPGTAPPEARG